MNQTFSDPTGQVSARIIAHTKSAVTGIEMKTFEWEYPRIILAEVNTHKALGKNTSSSRAIPVKTLLEQVRNNPSMPVRFGAANSGMQDNGVHTALVKHPFLDVHLPAEEAWRDAIAEASEWQEAFYNAGYAKQVCNRLTEAGQRIKQVVSGTDFENVWWLRDHDAADPTIAALIKCARQALEASTPTVLQPGEWHVPYYNDGVWKFHQTVCMTPGGRVAVDKFGHSLEHALIISASCCAQASYRKLDDTIEKARSVYARLNLHGEEPDDPVHASPLEHQGTPIQKYTVDYTGMTQTVNGLYSETWEEGITHMRRDGVLCSGNLRGYIQHRQLVPNHVREG